MDLLLLRADFVAGRAHLHVRLGCGGGGALPVADGAAPGVLLRGARGANPEAADARAVPGLLPRRVVGASRSPALAAHLAAGVLPPGRRPGGEPARPARRPALGRRADRLGDVGGARAVHRRRRVPLRGPACLGRRGDLVRAAQRGAGVLEPVDRLGSGADGHPGGRRPARPEPGGEAGAAGGEPDREPGRDGRRGRHRAPPDRARPARWRTATSGLPGDEPRPGPGDLGARAVRGRPARRCRKRTRRRRRH